MPTASFKGCSLEVFLEEITIALLAGVLMLSAAMPAFAHYRHHHHHHHHEVIVVRP